ncbi:hypothetical protein INT47_011776 [Mucor saturninus]|uniref:Uncharacterized protein n=1 Tax=Mucor saturninus TaxID=64648 RepID=A0A8H7QF83_9FUNG|nr:hypothetical protein INT47_011776 [Mucor saturninus]
MNIIRKFVSYNAGPRLADMVLADYRLYHNTDVGSRNRYGKVCKGHYSPWLYQSINTIRIKLGHTPIDSYFTNRLGSTFEYEQTQETYGITALPNEVMREYNILLAINHLSNQTFSKAKLLELSLLPVVKLDIIGCSLAVTAVHADQEVKLYKDYMKNPEKRRSIASHLEKQHQILYALLKYGQVITSRPLESYYNVLDERQKYYDTVIFNIDTVRLVRSALTSESRSTVAIPAHVQITADQAVQRMIQSETVALLPPPPPSREQH